MALLALCTSCGRQDTAPVAEVAAPIVSVAGAREFAVGEVRFTMVPVEGGTFMMGATAEQQPLALEREYPPHRVTVSDYWLGQTPVTQGLWLAVMGHNPSEFSREKGHGDWATRPVEMVSYNDCLVFIARLDSITGEPFRLPTEAEWEYAARGGNRSMHYRFAGGNDADSVAWQSLKKGKLQRRDWDDINDALDILSKANIRIDDTAGVSIMEMKSKCRRLKAENKLDLIIIDYLQLMNPEGRSLDSRTQEISVISRNLKLLARELDCPVIVLSQLSRNPEQRTDHRPMLSDLRDSGSIEQDADIVIFLYRDEYYNENTDAPGECEVIIAKQRSGPTGTVKVAWLDKITKFVDSAGSGNFSGF